jgi:transposase
MLKTLILTREEFDKIYDQGREATYALFVSLVSRIEELERRLGMNSTNSSKPPSSDGFTKPKPNPKSLREKTGKKPGGQEGHPGKTLAPKEDPDFIVVHEPHQCDCGCNLNDVAGTVVHKRQIADLPEEIALQFTEHRVIEKECPHCHQKSQGEFPEWINDTAVQYGPQILALLTYLNVGQYLSYERIVEMSETIFGFTPSEGTIYSALERCYEGLESFEEKTKDELKEGEVLHCDETGIRMEGKTGWLHVASTDEQTYYHVDEKRGKEAFERMGLLPEYEGTVIHDCFSSYFQYEVSHGLCNAHLLRELRAVTEGMNQPWAMEMSELLRQGLKEKEEKGIPDAKGYEEYEKRYMEILERGKEQQPPPLPKPEGQRGRAAKSPSLNLLERMERYREYVLAFLRKEEVPFTNNQAERDIRMVKVKMKVSGGFRTKEGACMFARIRAAISTFQKQDKRIFDELKAVFMPTPFQPAKS